MTMRWCRLYKGTPAELAIEDAIAALGVPYRSQFPGFLYGFRYFCDFLLPTLKLVIEVDDPSHNRADKILSDEDRTTYLETQQGWTVVRCTNEEALSDPHGAVRRMLTSAGLWPLPTQLPKLAASLPTPKKCPKKIKRDAKMAARITKRQKRCSRNRSLVANRNETERT